MKNQKNHASLKEALMCICSVRSEKGLLSVLNTQLPRLLNVDKIELKEGPGDTEKKNIYSFMYGDQNYFVHFHTSRSLQKEDKSSLKKVGKALKWTLVRLQKQKQLKMTKEQWELAFDAITVPISLTDREGSIRRTNKTFRESVKKSKTALLRQNSFEVFFGEKATPHQNRQKKDLQGQTFEIISQKLEGKELYLLVFRNISEKIKMEKEMAENVKSSEMDIISSSMAHELNNPVAGIQALLQTMPIRKDREGVKDEDIQEMTQAVQRCSQIIQKLLKVDP